MASSASMAANCICGEERYEPSKARREKPCAFRPAASRQNRASGNRATAKPLKRTTVIADRKDGGEKPLAVSRRMSPAETIAYASGRTPERVPSRLNAPSFVALAESNVGDAA